MAISLKPSDAVEGGLKTVNADLTWKDVHFENFTYTNKAGEAVGNPTIALMVTLVDEGGEDHVQAYSVGNPERYQIVNSGKGLDGAAMNKSCNAFILIDNLINAGFPEQKIGEDISILNGLVAHHIGIPVKEREGLNSGKPADPNARPKILSVPSAIVKLPWEKKGAKPATGTKTAAQPSGDAVALAVEFVGKTIGESGETTRKDLATAVYKDAKNPNKDAIAGAIFSPAFNAALLAAGYTVSGENISR